MGTYHLARLPKGCPSQVDLSLARLPDCIIHICVHSSYQTNNGIVSGIQWIPAEATSVIPAGAQPATPVCRTTLCPSISISDKEEINQSINQEFVSSWNRGSSNRDEKALKEWFVG